MKDINSFFNNSVPFPITIKNLSYDEFIQLINNEEFLQHINRAYLMPLITKIETNDLKILLKNKKILEIILDDKTPRTVYDIISDEKKEIILNNYKLFNNNENKYQIFLKKYLQNTQGLEKVLNLSPETQKIIGELDFKTPFATKENENFFKNNPKLKPLLLFIETKEEIDTLIKYKRIVKYKVDDNKIEFINGKTIPRDMFDSINSKHISSLMDIMSDMGYIGTDEDHFYVAFKFYNIFGYDETRKILENKYSKASMQMKQKFLKEYKISYEKKDRLRNPLSYYSVENADYIIEKFNSGNYDLVKTILGIDEIPVNIDEELVKELYIYSRERRNKSIEEKANSIYINKTQDQFDLSLTYLKEIAEELELSNNLDKKGRVVPNEDLLNFLLGDRKNKNDCLLRMIFNNVALDLNDSLPVLINKFDVIMKCSKMNSQKRISLCTLCNISDVLSIIEMPKTPIIHDMTYHQIALLKIDTKYNNEQFHEVFKKVKKIHHNRYKKVYSTIPSVDVTSEDGTLKTMKFRDPSLITAGIAANNCLRIGGVSEKFLEDIMTGENANLLEIEVDLKKYYCPVYRNGNVIFANGIDPKPSSLEETNKINELIKLYGKKVILTSIVNKDDIHALALTDLNQMNNLDQYPRIDMDDYQELTDVYHTDYKMSEFNHIVADRRKTHIIIGVSDFINPDYGKRKPKYNQSREKHIYLSLSNIKDEQERDSIIAKLNHILILEHDYKNIPHLYNEKMITSLEDIDEIYLSDDWFVLTSSSQIKSISCAPYDARAEEEISVVLNTIKNIENEGKSK